MSGRLASGGPRNTGCAVLGLSEGWRRYRWLPMQRGSAGALRVVANLSPAMEGRRWTSLVPLFISHQETVAQKD